MAATWKKLAYDAEVVKHSLATAENDFLVAPASGSFVKKTLAETKTILGINNDGSRLTRIIYQAFHGFAVGDVLKYASGVYAKAKADTAANAEVIGIVSEVPDVDYFVLLMNGIITGLSGLTTNSVHYLSSATVGALTATEPTTAGHISKPLLIAISTTAGFFFNMRGVSVGDSYIDHILEKTADHGVAIDGLTLKDGNIVLSGGQIAFPATANPSSGANTLDDYEEGGWTPALSSTGATFSYSFQSANYTKIGRQVFLYFLIALTGAPTGTLTNVVLMTGLPFSIGSGSLHGFTSLSSGMSKSPTLIDNSSSTVQFRDIGGAQLTAAIFTGAAYFYGFLTHA